MKRAILKGTGRYLPPRVVTNDDLAQWMDTSDEWIRQRTGIEQRHWIPEEGGVGASDLGLEASKAALGKAGWAPEDIDLIIFGTLSPDIFFPGSGCILQHKLGLDSTPALDIRQQCTGFLYGLEIIKAYIESGLATRILLVGAEVHSTGLNVSTKGRDVTVIFGDGAGAACFEAVDTEEEVGILATSLHARGEFYDSLMIEAPASRENPRISEAMLKDDRHFPYMDGQTIFRQAVKMLPKVAKKTLAMVGISKDEVDLYIPHQANMRINQFFQELMKLEEGKVFHNIQRYGNTTAGSIPIALDEALEMKLIGAGSTICMLGFGAGLTWGSVIYRFPA